MAEHPPGARGDRDDVERVQATGVHGGRQSELEDQFPRAVPHTDFAEAHALIQPAGLGVVRRHQQPHPAAARDAAQTVHHFGHGGAAIAMALLAAVQREPAEPPARRIAWLGVYDEKAGQRATDFDRHGGMCEAALHGTEDVADGAEKALDLVGIKVKSAERIELGTVETAVSKGRSAPGG